MRKKLLLGIVVGAVIGATALGGTAIAVTSASTSGPHTVTATTPTPEPAPTPSATPQTAPTLDEADSGPYLTALQGLAAQVLPTGTMLSGREYPAAKGAMATYSADGHTYTVALQHRETPMNPTDVTATADQNATTVETLPTGSQRVIAASAMPGAWFQTIIVRQSGLSLTVTEYTTATTRQPAPAARNGITKRDTTAQTGDLAQAVTDAFDKDESDTLVR